VPKPRVLVISPVRNEGAHIARVARALAAQTTPPASWVVIDDSSGDDTYEQLSVLSEEIPFMTLLRAPAQAPGARDRLARAAEVRNFNLALHRLIAESPEREGGPTRRGPLALAHPSAGASQREQGPTRRGPLPLPFTHVMKLDGDIELPRDYLGSLLERFAADPRLGLAGGVLVEPAPSGAMRRIAIPRHHVHGALKCWTRACFGAIGGVQERLGWDTIDETYARMRGFHTRNFRDLVCIHHRPLASADGLLRGHARYGECAYIVHYGPLWVTLRALKMARRRPVGLSGVAFLLGYARAATSGTERVPDAAYRSFTRRELRARMLGPLAGVLGSLAGALGSLAGTLAR
jgi:biofilm PGA synthesis N-glycosyltransferase PgaC